MAELHVDVGGLRSAAGGSGALAEGLAAGADAGAAPRSAAHASAAGVAAMNAALAAVKTRHSERIGRQADTLTVASARYDTTDTDGGQAITSVSV